MPIKYSSESPFFDIRKKFFRKFYNTFLASYIGNFFKFFFNLETYYTKRKIDTWAKGGVGKFSDPSNFLNADKTDKRIFQEINKLITKKDKVLDLGCNCGRTLNVLYKNGFYNLDGLDIMKSALELGKNNFSELYEDCNTNFYCDSFQNFLKKVPANTYDLIYTRGATVELINPYFPLVKNLCKASKKYVLLCIFENSHYYPRFWEIEFLREDFHMISLERLTDSNYYTYMIFEYKPDLKSI